MTTTAPPADGDLAYVPAWADRVELFFSRVLVHTKGRWARVPFNLTAWQADDIIRPLFGTARYDAQLAGWVRLYNEAWLELGRGNGKSEILAGLALYLLTGDDEESAEVYGAAKDKDQAALVFNVAARMVALSPYLSKRLTVIESKKRIVDPKTASVYQVIAADAEGNLGQDPHGIVFDEIIAQPTRDLFDALRTGLGKRAQPLLVCATTAGNDPSSFAANEHTEALKVAEDPTRQPNRLVYIRNTPTKVTAEEAEAEGWVTVEAKPVEPGDVIEGGDTDELLDVDAFAEANWHHANPALRSGFLSLAVLRSEAAAAKVDPLKENSFRQYRLNQWVSQATRAIPLHVWDESGTGEPIDRAALVGREAFGGLDLAATTDLAAYVTLFPPLDPDAPPDTEDGRIPVLWHFWTPEANVIELDKHTGGAFSTWVARGLVNVTPGEVIDYAEIHRQIQDDRQDFRLRDVSVDPWNATSTIAWGQRNRVTIVSVAQTFRALSPPTKELLRLIRTRQLDHGGDPVARWNVDSLELKRDNADNVRPVKPERGKSGRRIDGIVALIMATDGYTRRGNRRRSAYEDHDLDVI